MKDFESARALSAWKTHRCQGYPQRQPAGPQHPAPVTEASTSSEPILLGSHSRPLGDTDIKKQRDSLKTLGGQKERHKLDSPSACLVVV